MKRFAATLLSTALVTALVGLTSSAPAVAQNVCFGQGNLFTGAPFFYPSPTVVGTNIGFREVHITSFAMTFTTHACIHVPNATTSKAVTASGMATGWCGLSTGAGTTGNGHPFAWIGAGSFLILTGHVTGVMNIMPDVPGGQSCSPVGSGATRFLMTGAVVLLRCSGLQQADELQGPNTVGPFTDDTTWHMWVNVCIPDASLSL